MRTIKNYFKFIKGLISEASPLTFPENAAINISNLDLFRTGLIARRLGINAEEDFTLLPASPFDSNIVINGGICANVWENVGNEGGRNFLVVQIGATLYFHDMSAQGSLSQNILPFTVNLDNFVSILGTDAGKYQISSASGSGYLFVSSPVLNLFAISYSSQNNTITSSLVNCQIRDTVGIVEDIANDFNPPDLTTDHNYNLLNQSWTSDTIQAFDIQYKNYPSNAQVWYESKDSSGNFDPAGMANISFGNTQAARGHYLLNLYDQDRSNVSGIPGIDPVLINTRATGIAFFSGRLFMAIDDKIYFSQIIQDISQAGKFYQDADPTAEIDSSLVPSDGGVIPITGCAKITTLIATETAIVIGATNGIWVLTGYSGNDFNATNYRVMFVANVGVGSQNNMCQVENLIIIVSDGGIYALGTSDRGNPEIRNMTEKTIQTFYLEIPRAARQGSTLFYDNTAKRVYMMYDANANDNIGLYRNQYDSMLIWDMDIDAWTTYSLSLPVNVIGGIYDSFTLSTPVITGLDLAVTVGNDVVTVNGETVTIEDEIPLIEETSLGYLLVTGNLTDGFQYTFGSFSNQNFNDFYYVDNVGADYTSYLITGYELVDDVVRRKSAPFIWCHFQRTEQNWIDDGAGNPTYDFPSGCLMNAIWEWANNNSAFRRSFPQEVYRFKDGPVSPPVIGRPFDYPYDVIQTKTSIRGHGKCFSLQFMSETGKDMRLYGWAVEIQIKDTPS